MGLKGPAGVSSSSRPTRAYAILKRLEERYGRREKPGNWPEGWRIPPPPAPFQVLVATILSQNTSDRLSRKAYERLEAEIGVTPRRLALAPLEGIKRCIRTAGLHDQKARCIQEFSRALMEGYGGRMEPILTRPFHEARRTLTSFRGIGKKTADVVLLFCAGKPVIPLDTHVKLVSYRLGLAPRGGYDTVRLALESQLDPPYYWDFHLLLIQLGRDCCRARKPLCDRCPVLDLCDRRV